MNLHLAQSPKITTSTAYLIHRSQVPLAFSLPAALSAEPWMPRDPVPVMTRDLAASLWCWASPQLAHLYCQLSRPSVHRPPPSVTIPFSLTGFRTTRPSSAGLPPHCGPNASYACQPPALSGLLLPTKAALATFFSPTVSLHAPPHLPRR